ncbi:MAG TPA: J domain-containing protein [Anaerolineaceae bacterium]|nr:J domain-containing protein [Anaerolineaceae bacterium]HPN52097.1 J domain-containing protein [Anaerolineaceae bacterium]
MEYKDYYKILGVPQNASDAEIKRAYRKLAMTYHPDRNPGDRAAEEKFKEINEAYQVLGDAERRSRYDQLGESYSSWQQTGGAGGFNWGDWFTRQPQGQGRTTVTAEDLNEAFGGAGGFSDFFSAIFGGAAQTSAGGARRTRRPAVYDQPVVISFAEAFKGTERTLQVGSRRLEVKIPAGAHTGTRVRVPRGGPSESDLHLIVEVSEDPRFERQGDNLYTETTIDLFTAVLGGQASVTTPAGNVLLTIPAGTQPGATFRLSGRGMPHLKDPQHAGDLFARIKVTLPKQLNDQQRALFEQLRSLTSHH